MSCPTDLQIRGAEAISLILPRATLALSLKQPDHQHGRVLPRETPIAALLGRQMAALAMAAPHLGRHEATTLAPSVRDLVASYLGLGTDSRQEPSVLEKPYPARQVRLYIEQHLEREALTPTSIMNDLGVSRSQLYRQFERFGGVQTYIRRRRLRRALVLLCNPRHAGQRIGDIAYGLGFTDEAHFSRLFRQAFGLSPRAARASALRADTAALSAFAVSSSDTSPLAFWLRELGLG
jgi:AraC-like DNA-binding protein